jgi:arginyl-tRNA synthetase
VVEEITNLIGLAIRESAKRGEIAIDEIPPIVLESPKDKAHGDLATNVALTLSGRLKMPPRKIAEIISGSLYGLSSSGEGREIIRKIEVAGPGFINFTLNPQAWFGRLPQIIDAGDRWGRSNKGNGKKVQVEFVSVNPTGLLHVGHGRQAAYGDTIASLLEWTGYRVTREYYFNNAGRQMRLLAQSLYARYMELFDPAFPLPEEGYKGEYIKEIAEKICQEKRDSLKGSDDLSFFKDYAEEHLSDEIKRTLARMGVKFDVYYNEDTLYTSGKVYEVVEELRKRGLAYDKDGAVWFKLTELGLGQDRVIVKSTGEPTYRLPDIAYHRDKFIRGFDLIVDIFGADHIATAPDVLAGIRELGYDPNRVKVLILQMVNLIRDGQPVKMSKRRADFVTLDELLDEVGPDAVRYFMVARSINSHINFDLNLAKEKSEVNPVYYLQYAHARIASIIRFARERGFNPSNGCDLSRLGEEEEALLAKMLIGFPEVVEGAAASYEPHRLTGYLHEVAAAFHKFYHNHQVVSDDRGLAMARLALCMATKIVLANGFKILGISAPEKM